MKLGTTPVVGSLAALLLSTLALAAPQPVNRWYTESRTAEISDGLTWKQVIQPSADITPNIIVLHEEETYHENDPTYPLKFKPILQETFKKEFSGAKLTLIKACNVFVYEYPNKPKDVQHPNRGIYNSELDNYPRLLKLLAENKNSVIVVAGANRLSVAYNDHAKLSSLGIKRIDKYESHLVSDGLHYYKFVDATPGQRVTDNAPAPIRQQASKLLDPAFKEARENIINTAKKNNNRILLLAVTCYCYRFSQELKDIALETGGAYNENQWAGFPTMLERKRYLQNDEYAKACAEARKADKLERESKKKEPGR